MKIAVGDKVGVQFSPGRLTPFLVVENRGRIGANGRQLWRVRSFEGAIEVELGEDEMYSLKTMPKQKPGKSKQDYGTPIDFINAVEARFGKLHIDLAGTEQNKKAPKVITPEQNSLTKGWSYGKRLWLNPPFGHIESWARKCAGWRGELAQARLRMKSHLYALAEPSRLFFLTPASVGANWFRDHVHGKALVLALNGRLTFEGETAPFPKDCCLSVYGAEPGFEVWNWRLFKGSKT